MVVNEKKKEQKGQKAKTRQTREKKKDGACGELNIIGYTSEALGEVIHQLIIQQKLKNNL